MIKEQYERLKMGQNVRETLITLKQELKEERARREMLSILHGDYHILTALLEDPQPKVRKNAALILGRLKQPENAPALLKAYEKETQLFVKSDYLKALGELNHFVWGQSETATEGVGAISTWQRRRKTYSGGTCSFAKTGGF